MASIADILIAKGNAAANARLARGVTYADLIRNLSSIPGQVVQETRANQLAQSRMALEQGQQQLQQQALQEGQQKLAAGTRQQQEAGVLDQVWSDPAVYAPDGTINRTGLQQRLSSANMGHLAPVALETADRLDESRALLAQKQQALSESYRETLGKDALELDKAGNDPGLFHLIVADRAKAGVIPRDQAETLLKAETPADVASITARWKAGSSAGKPQVLKLGKDEVAYDERNMGAGPLATGPAGAPNETEVALKAAGGDPAKAMQILKPTTPRPIEEQLLEAVASGDKAKAANITTTMRMAASAKQDPAAAAMALQLKNLSAAEAQARLDKMRAEAQPINIEPDIQTTMNGKKYIDASLYTGATRDKAIAAAGQAGVVPVSKEQASALQDIDTARSNQRDILAQIDAKLPSGPAGRVASAVTVPLSKFFQTDAQVAAFNSWRTAAIQTLRSTAGSKGLRINQQEIALAIENDIPKLTDTVSVARQKVANITTMLDNAENSIVTRDRSAQPVAPAAPTDEPPPGIQGLRNR